MPLMWIPAALLITALLLVVGWYLLIKTEGIYLGWRVVVWLYDVYASRYDRIKNYDRTYEAFFLAQPIARRLVDVPQPLVLDVATGTGRLPLALLDQWGFDGRVIGLDLSHQMLFQAAVKLFPHCEDCALIWHTAMDLPFPDEAFDLVTCIEAWEFLPRPVDALQEMIRVLRPGGWLLMTNRRGRDARLMPGHTFSTEQVFELLETEMGLVDVEKNLWQVDYELFWARKPGDRVMTGERTLADVLRCPACGKTTLIALESAAWVCTTCETRVPVGEDGVIELFGAQL